MKLLCFLFSIVAGTNLLLAADFPAPYDSGKPATGLMPAADAAASMKLPPGFKASVFAAEPDVCNPISMSWDNRGRLWVAENYTYAESGVRYDMRLRDRILIFEDAKGDGHFSSRKVFTDELQMLTSVEVGPGGVWVLALPNLMFIPTKPGSDVPAGPPVVVLDGFPAPRENYHNIANGLRFGPDGWLYGRCGASGAADVGVPGTPMANRIPVRGGMWRYHPQRKIFEAICSGNTNPWGHDWNQFGEIFYTNTVNGHLWHEITGAHFVRGATIELNPHIYTLLDQHADHFHFDIGKSWTSSRNGAADSFGGGHAHIGAMVYLGDNWPDSYRGHLFTLNQHGRRINQDILEPSGSGYVGRHGQDMMFVSDPWFIGIDLAYGPDGGVFVLDWSNTGECHGRDGVQRSTGRIYKVTYGDAKIGPIDLRLVDQTALVELHTHKNEWFSRQARIELERRAKDGQDLSPALKDLRNLFETNNDEVVKLRAMWTLYALGGIDDGFLHKALNHPSEHVRIWAIRMISDNWPLDTLTGARPTWPAEYVGANAASTPWQHEFVTLAEKDPAASVRLALASLLQRLPDPQRLELAAALVVHKEDATGAAVPYHGDPADHNLPLMLWYGLIPTADSDPAGLAKVAENCQLPQTRRLIARRLAEEIEKQPTAINELIRFAKAQSNVDITRDVIAGLTQGLAGWRKAPKPNDWDALVASLSAAHDETLTASARELSILFGDGRALDEVKRVVMDKDADLEQRKAAMRTLIEANPPDLQKICESLLNVRFLNTLAARGLARFDDPKVATKLVGAYRQFHQTERPQVLAALVSRPSFAGALLDAIAAGKIARDELTPFQARQIQSFHDAALDKKLASSWGELRDISADKKKFSATLKESLTPAELAKADLSNGRMIFAKTCAVCHRLYGQGADIGPDLTGSGRANIDYLLENVIDPSAVVPVDFRMVIVKLNDGRVINGIVSAKTAKTISLKSPTERVTIDLGDIAKMVESPQSLMPEGLLEGLPAAQQRDLLAYLMHPSQVALPENAPVGGK